MKASIEMLTDKTPVAPEPGIAEILAMIGGGKPTTIVAKGIFQIGHFSGEQLLPGEWDKYPTLSDVAEDEWTNCYGVCDDIQQLLDRCPMLVEDPDREFAITLTEIRRDEQPANGGWRWHKWGPYIGAHEPQCEYLYDEEGIDRVFCYHVFEVKK
jgi:hypothetical protein